MLTGTGFEWMDYELFSAFIFQSAATVVIVLAIVFVVLSVFVTRPYCRFVCPTGTLFKLAEGNK
jgi:polyferredoxin